MIKSESAGNSHHLGQLVSGQESRRSPSRHGHEREKHELTIKLLFTLPFTASPCRLLPLPETQRLTGKTSANSRGAN